MTKLKAEAMLSFWLRYPMTSSRASAIAFSLLALAGPALFGQAAAPILSSVEVAFWPPQGLSPGALAVAFGSNLAATTTIDGPGQTQVTVGGTQALVYYSSPNFIQFRIPPTLKSNAKYQVVVSNQGGVSNAILVVLNQYSPALSNNQNNGLVIATRSDLSILTPNSPAMTGEKITVYATGLGVPDPSPAQVSITVGGALAAVESVSPNFINSAAYAVTFAVPAGAASGLQPFVLSIGGQNSQTELFPVQGTGLYSSQTGVTLRGVAGGTAALVQNVTIASNNGAISWTTSVTTLSGGAWLRVPNGVGTSDPAKPAPAIQITATANALQPGDYYGLVTVHPTNSNSDLLISVVLTVLAQNQSPGPTLDPTGIIFIAGPGQIPAARTITIRNPGAGLTFTTTTSFPPNNNWFKVFPTTGAVGAGQTATVAVQPSTGLPAGVYAGSVSFQFSDGNARVVSLLFVVAAGATPSGPNGGDLAETRPPQAGCTPTMLVPSFTQLGVNFTSPVGWPSPMEAAVVDDCGSPMSSGSVVAHFSNGDVQKSLLNFQNGRWSATWTPVHSFSVLTVTLTADSTSPALTGSVQVSGGVPANPLVPIISSNGVVSQASYATSPAPGTLIAIFGLALTDRVSFADGLPLPNQVLSTSVIIGGVKAPILYVSEGQVNAQAPYNMARGNYSMIVQRGNAYSSPETIAVFASQPAVFTVDSSGKGQGTIFKVTPTSQILAAPGAAATADDVLTIYCAGLGEVSPALGEGIAAPLNPLANTVNTVTATIGAVDAKILFSGLTPGFVGLYQVNLIVPQGVAPGDAVPVVLTVAGNPSLPVTMAVR